MREDISRQASGYHASGRRRRLWQRIVSGLAAVVVFCTTYALILPAITLEQNAFCGKEEHIHDDNCYSPGETVTLQTLVCATEESPGHSHGEACFLPVHTHGESCWQTAEAALLCGQEESEGHTHAGIRVLQCAQEESETHAHEAACYSAGCFDENEQLLCTLEELPEHTHSTDCYTTPEPELICTLGERTEPELICEEAETEGHAHAEDCYEVQEIPGEPVLNCQQQEHTHQLSCYSDTSADVESESIWKRSIPEALSGVWAEDLVEVARSQLGYQESVKNYIVEEDGSIAGYTRYGDWAGTPYADWNETFILFCLHYANVPEEVFPLPAQEKTWMQVLEEAGLYRDGDYTPAPGDLIFLTTGEDAQTENLAGIVTGVTEDGYVTAVVGDLENLVNTGTWHLSDPEITGYAKMPENPVEETIPEETVPEETVPEETLPEETVPEETVPEETVPEETIPEETVPEETVPEETIPEETIPEETIPEETVPEETIPEETVPEETVPEETIPEETIPYICGLSEHTHGESCSDAEGNLTCTQAEHTHDETCLAAEEADPEVAQVIALIDALPTSDEVESKLLAYEEAEDWDGYEFYYTQIGYQGRDVYQEYMMLTPAQQEQVTNVQKLWDLEWLWSAQILLDKIASDTPTMVKSASTSEFIDLNLYDYGSNINAKYDSNNKYPGFQWNGGAYLKSTYDRHQIDYIDFGNSMITDFDYAGSSNGKATTAQMITQEGTGINAIDVTSYGVTNRPIGMSTGEEVLLRTLKDGYPALADGTTLSYLFSNGTYATKKNTASIDGLFQKNETTGAYFYNSRENHAQYGNNKFTLYKQIITPNFITYPFGNFLPLNDITNGSNATQVSKITHVGGGGTSGVGYLQSIINRLLVGSEDATEQQLIDMIAMYRSDLGGSTNTSSNWHTWTAADALNDYFHEASGDNPSDAITFSMSDSLLKKLYNIDFDVDTNFFFGMDMSMTFMQPKGGLTGNDGKQEMVFYFTGDDDVWVYIDEVLFLDLSGIHRHVGGEIDFVNGKVHYYYLDTANTGDVSTTPYKTYTFAELLTAAGKSTDSLNSKGTFKDYTYHDFKFFYMERGSGSSVCRLNFNFPLLRRNSLSVSKELTVDDPTKLPLLGNPDFRFQVLKANSDGTRTETLFIGAGVEYTIYDTDNNVLGTGTTDANGVFTLKAGQRAEFADISENSGKYYVRELLDADSFAQYGTITVDGSSTTTNFDVMVGSDTFTGVTSPVKDASDGTTVFNFNNQIQFSKLGSLEIGKVLETYPQTRTIREFQFYVTLDGEPIPVGTAYTVDGTDKTVETEGIIIVPAGSTAHIPKIIAGTVFTVTETEASAEGYTVTYSGAGVTTNGTSASGTIGVSTTVRVTVTNSENGTDIEIPVTKNLSKHDGNTRTYRFKLEQVTDATGETLTDGGAVQVLEIPVADTGQGSFPLYYTETAMESVPAVFYYRITEEQLDGVICDDSTYVVEVTVTADDTGALQAAITNRWRDGAAASGVAFTNTLTGQLSLSKTVVGLSAGQTYGFTIGLSPGDSGLAVLPDSFDVVLNHADGTTETANIPFADGVLELRMSHGESLTILNIPYGTQWAITETSAGDFIVSHTVDGTAGTGAASTGSIGTGETQVAYTNTTTYELPETGGIGTTLYTTAGLLLMISAASLLYMKKRGKEEFS